MFRKLLRALVFGKAPAYTEVATHCPLCRNEHKVCMLQPETYGPDGISSVTFYCRETKGNWQEDYDAWIINRRAPLARRTPAHA